MNESNKIRSNDSNDLNNIKSFQRTCDFLLIELCDIINIFLCKYTTAHLAHMPHSWWSLQASLATVCYFYYKTSDPCFLVLKKMETENNYCHFQVSKSLWIFFMNNLSCFLSINTPQKWSPEQRKSTFLPPGDTN